MEWILEDGEKKKDFYIIIKWKIGYEIVERGRLNGRKWYIVLLY